MRGLLATRATKKTEKNIQTLHDLRQFKESDQRWNQDSKETFIYFIFTSNEIKLNKRTEGQISPETSMCFGKNAAALLCAHFLWIQDRSKQVTGTQQPVHGLEPGKARGFIYFFISCWHPCVHDPPVLRLTLMCLSEISRERVFSGVYLYYEYWLGYTHNGKQNILYLFIISKLHLLRSSIWRPHFFIIFKGMSQTLAWQYQCFWLRPVVRF